MEIIEVSAIDIRDYAITQKWTLVKEALQDGLFVLNSPNSDYMQLVFPKDDSSPFFQEMAWITLNKLAKIYNFSLKKMIEQIRDVNDDVISLRYFSENKTVYSISFKEAYNAINATRQMLLASASTVIAPALHHPKKHRPEAQDLIKNTKFRHTEEGSFILKISHPCELKINHDLFTKNEQYEKPFSRNVFENMNNSAIKISSAIEADDIFSLFNNEKMNQRPEISYDFCDSLSKLFDEEREIPFQLIFNWSKASLQKIDKPNFSNQVIFPYSNKSKIDAVKAYFEPPKQGFLREETFYGTVDTLDGNVGKDEKRSGYVTITILYKNETFKVKVNLSSNNYQMALKAHEKGNAFVKIIGDLRKGTRHHHIENVQSFSLVE